MNIEKMMEKSFVIGAYCVLVSFFAGLYLLITFAVYASTKNELETESACGLFGIQFAPLLILLGIGAIMVAVPLLWHLTDTIVFNIKRPKM